EPKGEGLSEVLTDMLRGAEDATNPAVEGLKKRVPFGREDMQLSFAPLVKNTAPAVVNVYASSKVQARSPFEGDPFFERFF
ncbi:serine protease, partial [Rhizobiaceae sp. 2RAB30]